VVGELSLPLRNSDLDGHVSSAPRLDRPLVLLNLLFLGTIAFVPYPSQGGQPAGPRIRGMAKGHQRCMRRSGIAGTKHRLTGEQRAFNRCQAGLRLLLEQAAHLARVWALCRWPGLLYRVQDVFPGGCRAGVPGLLAPSGTCMTEL
jgi:hypothetical protein